MRTVLLALMVVATGAGCVTARVRAEAAPTLRCDPEQVVLEERENFRGTWVASGCGRLAVCTLRDVHDAEVSCAGGASVTYSPIDDTYSEVAVAPELKPRGKVSSPRRARR